MAVTARRTSVTSVVPGRMPCALHLPESRRCRSYRPTSRVGQGRSSTSGTRFPLPPCGSLSGSLDPRESRRHRTSPTPGDHRVSPATAALAGSHLRPPGARIPPSCACLRQSLSSGAFRLLTADFATSTHRSPASEHVAVRTGGCNVEFDVSADRFRQVLLPRRSSRMFAYTTFAVADPKECHVNWSKHDGE